MKQRKETKVDAVFNVESLISILRGLRMQEHKPESSIYGDNGVCYDFWQLLYVEDGNYTCQIEGCSPSPICRGQLLICEPEKIRFSWQVTDTVVSFINIRCTAPQLRQMKNRVFTLSEEEQKDVDWILEKGIRTFCRVPDTAPFRGQQPLEGISGYQLQALKNRIELLLISLYDRFSQQPVAQGVHNYYEQKFCQIEAYMKNRLYDQITVADICAQTGFSASTVKRIFSQQVQCGVIHYFLKLKTNEAIRLLMETELTVTQISEMLGFSSVHYFSRIFKRFAGASPRSYAESAAHKR